MSADPKILYVDDEEDLVILASSFFEDEGLPIDISTDFHDALEKVKSGKYEIIISDARMPTGSGYELLSTVRSQKLFSGKFILVTGNPDDSQSREYEYDLVLLKPVKFEELVDKVKELLNI